ncbi:TrkH family potassium uptake protein [Pseudalkalibacillus caeni]|uniref:TrkH family potassium uptake protein n=1 Tax=Exobacillus caeni TaxID=2574798 RepID=A0A5R9FBP4_9BACL|nr:TrkH family potassium uptake protein [Pseudalkalibacillus caeni]TLS37045.1 TrkH family potassium uptake protein [Pseudalkalibacillus caeni]
MNVKDDRNTQRITRRLTSVQLIVLFYVSAVVISTILVSLPFAHRPGVELSFVDAVFTAVSAVSVTGLTVVSTIDTFNTTGYFISMFILQFGGIGIMTLGTFVWLLFGKKIGFRERQLIMTDQNRSTFSGLVRLMKQILGLILLIEFIGFLILGTYFMKYFPTWQEAYIQGAFASVSATTNAGFDITGSSLVPFAQDYFVQFINITLLILGAIGFPVLIEVKEYLIHRGNFPFRFSLYTKLTTFTFFALVLIGTLFILVFEQGNFFQGKTWHESFFYALFQSVTTRNGGLATMDVSEFNNATLLGISSLMFIGASPSSVGGGIRTTTFAIALLSIYSFAKGKNTIKVFNREIDQQDVIRSFIVIVTAGIICFFAVILLIRFEPFHLMEITFEVASAFGTTGLSMGITSELSTPGKIIIIALMFIGRIGIFSLLFIIRGKEVKDRYQYPKERVIIG